MSTERGARHRLFACCLRTQQRSFRSVKPHEAGTRCALLHATAPAPDPTAIIQHTVVALEQRVLSFVNDRRTVGEIARQVDLTTTEVAAVVTRLRDLGAVEAASVELDVDDGCDQDGG